MTIKRNIQFWKIYKMVAIKSLQLSWFIITLCVMVYQVHFDDVTTLTLAEMFKMLLKTMTILW